MCSVLDSFFFSLLVCLQLSATETQRAPRLYNWLQRRGNYIQSLTENTWACLLYFMWHWSLDFASGTVSGVRMYHAVCLSLHSCFWCFPFPSVSHLVSPVCGFRLQGAWPLASLLPTCCSGVSPPIWSAHLRPTTSSTTPGLHSLKTLAPSSLDCLFTRRGIVFRILSVLFYSVPQGHQLWFGCFLATSWLVPPTVHALPVFSSDTCCYLSLVLYLLRYAL